MATALSVGVEVIEQKAAGVDGIGASLQELSAEIRAQVRTVQSRVNGANRGQFVLQGAAKLGALRFSHLSPPVNLASSAGSTLSTSDAR